MFILYSLCFIVITSLWLVDGWCLFVYFECDFCALLFGFDCCTLLIRGLVWRLLTVGFILVFDIVVIWWWYFRYVFSTVGINYYVYLVFAVVIMFGCCNLYCNCYLLVAWYVWLCFFKWRIWFFMHENIGFRLLCLLCVCVVIDLLLR